jgi:hypothetical protein
MAFLNRVFSISIATTALLIMLSANLSGQIAINSPYTRFGLGMIVEGGLDPRTTGLGGLHYGIQREDHVIPANPASYVAFDTASFIFDAGLFGQNVTLRTTTLTDRGSFITLSHLLFGFPVTGWWKTSLGVLPFSYVGYDIFNEREVEGVGTVENIYQGSGGFNQVYWGNAFRIGKKLSAGFNFKYIFGTIDRFRGLSFPDSIEMKNTLITSSVTPSDFYGEIGLQYKTKLAEQLFIMAGVTFGPELQISAKQDLLATTYFGDINSVSFTRDTIEYEEGKKVKFTMPTRIGTGVSIGKEGVWMAGADFSWQNWKAYEYDGVSDSLFNKWKIVVGGEFTPDFRNPTSYFQRMTYRMGLHYGKTPIYLRGKHIDEIGISFGLSLPITKSRSTVNLSMAIGKRGTTDNSLIQENFFRFTLGVNIFERWFLRRKYY